MRATLAANTPRGGAGCTSDHPVERMVREAKVCEIGGGTSDIRRRVIARRVLRDQPGGEPAGAAPSGAEATAPGSMGN